MYVNCLSKPHGIDGRYLVVNRTRDYLNPSGNTITIGASGVTLTSVAAKQDKNLSALEDDLFGQTTKIETISGKVDTINDCFPGRNARSRYGVQRSPHQKAGRQDHHFR